MIMGVYGLFYGDTCLYVGKSTDIGRSFGEDLESLFCGEHHCKDLQEWFTDNNLEIEDVHPQVFETTSCSRYLNKLENEWRSEARPLFTNN